ncbi:MAG: sigma-70 family RNA polymerase sigma factor [Patescibacteria group bacterium]|jgi:RNA polymerase primary sigma factor
MASHTELPATFEEAPDDHTIDLILSSRRSETRALMAAFRSYPVIRSKAELDSLFEQYEAATDPKQMKSLYEAMLYGNVRLVLFYAHRSTRGKASLADLVQVGLMDGVRRALLDYDRELGVNFSSYASWWIKHAIKRYVADAGWDGFRIPVHLQDTMDMIRRASRNYATQYGHRPNDYELWKYLKTLDSVMAQKISLYQVVKLRKNGLNNPTKPLDARLRMDDSKGTTRGELTPDNDADVAEQVDARKLLEKYRQAMQKIQQALDQSMSKRDAQILRERLRLDGRPKKSILNALGKRLGVTRERVRQIQAKQLTLLSIRTGLPPRTIKRLARTIEELEHIVSSG